MIAIGYVSFVRRLFAPEAVIKTTLTWSFALFNLLPTREISKHVEYLPKGFARWIPAVIYIEDAVAPDDAEGPAPAAYTLLSFRGTDVDSDRRHPTTSRTAERQKSFPQLRLCAGGEPKAEMNVVERLEPIGLLSPESDVHQVLNTVVNNLIVTNNLVTEARARLLLTMPPETFTVGAQS